MIGLLRAGLLGFVLLTVIYLLVSVYARSTRREALEKEWDTDPAREGALQEDRHAFIESGMKDYDKGLKVKLLWLIYIVPTVGFLATIYVINWT